MNSTEEKKKKQFQRVYLLDPDSEEEEEEEDDNYFPAILSRENNLSATFQEHLVDADNTLLLRFLTWTQFRKELDLYPKLASDKFVYDAIMDIDSYVENHKDHLTFVIVAYLNKEMIGFAIFAKNKSIKRYFNSNYELLYLFVDPLYRKLNIGRKILEFANANCCTNSRRYCLYSEIAHHPNIYDNMNYIKTKEKLKPNDKYLDIYCSKETTTKKRKQ